MRNVLNGEKPYKFWVEIFCIYPLYSLTSFMELTFEIFTIYYLNPFYVLLVNNIYYIIAEIITFILQLSGSGLLIAHFILALSSEIFVSLGNLVYLEILELNFCGLNKFLKRRIIEKGEKEFQNLLSSNINDKDDIEDDYEDNECRESEKPEPISQYRNI